MPDITAALDAPVSQDTKNNGPLRKRLKLIEHTRLVPLLLSAMATIAILLPRCGAIVRSPWTCKPWARCEYDDVQALMLLTITLMTLLCGALCLQIAAVRSKRAKL